MKILSLGLDNSVLNKNSSLAKRVVEYGELAGKYTVLVPSSENKEIVLSEKAKVFGAKASNKALGLINIYYLAKKLLVKENYNIITVQDQYYLALIGWLLAKKLKIGLEIQVHGFEKYHGLRRLIAKYVLPRANTVRAVSQRLKKRLISEFGVQEERIMVVPIYVERITHNVERITRNDSKFIFLTVGRLVSVKNIKMQIKALANIVRRYPNIELWIAGEGKEKEKLRVTRNIKLLGWQNDLEKFYRQADAFLLTSNYEGWGMAVIEAASFGLPIIMTDVGCAGEVIKDGESGIVISVGNQKKLEEAMLRLIEDNELRKKLGENARLAVMELSNKEQTLELYKKSWGKAVNA